MTGRRPDRSRPFSGLEFPQDFEGLREFFRGSGHGPTRLEVQAEHPANKLISRFLRQVD